MISRLVEKQQVRPREQCRCECQPRPPASAERGGRELLPLQREAEAGQYGGGLRFLGLDIHLGELLVQLGQHMVCKGSRLLWCRSWTV